MSRPGRENTAHLPLVEGGPPRLRIAWRIDVLWSLRDVIVMVDGEVCTADPRPPSHDAMYVYRVPGIGTITVGTPARGVFRVVPNVALDGRPLPGTSVAPDLLDRAAFLCAGVFAAEILYAAWAHLSRSTLTATKAADVAVHVVLGAVTVALARAGRWGMQLAVCGMFAGILSMLSVVPRWAAGGGLFSFAMVCAHVALAIGFIDLTWTRRRP